MAGLLKLFRRPSPFTSDGFDVENPLWSSIRILVVGAGGLGCELLHSLALTGFTDLEVIDMDTIELSNLNRQFLFRTSDIGKSKAQVSADFVMKRCPGVSIRPHFGKIEDQSDEFYRSFHIILLGLDSVYARRWINAKVGELAERELDEATQQYRIVDAIPVIDGGTEGFRGSVKVIQMGRTACVECTMYMYPPAKSVPMCTLENIPRLPEHCVLYVKEKLWEDERPGESLDTDNEEHILWVAKRSAERQSAFRISGPVIDYAFTLGVVKSVIPAVGFTNAIVAASQVLECFKLATGVGSALNSYSFYSGGDQGITSNTQPLLPQDDCPVCGPATTVSFSFTTTTPAAVLSRVLAKLETNAVWKFAANPDGVIDDETLNTNVSLTVLPDGAKVPEYLKYGACNPLRLTDSMVGGEVQSVADILRAKCPNVSFDKGLLFEANCNNLSVRFFALHRDDC